MPNWCYNSVMVSAKTEAELEEFIQFASKTHTSRHINIYSREREVVVDENAYGVFWNFITPPDEVLDEYFGEQPQHKSDHAFFSPEWRAEMEEQRNKSNHWYDWNISNWDTKWDIKFDEYADVSIEPNNEGFYFHWYFETAWSPALPVYDKMSEMYPNLEFEYEITEEGNHFAGKLLYRNGVLVDDKIISNPTHEDYISLEIPCLACWGDCHEYIETNTTTEEKV